MLLTLADKISFYYLLVSIIILTEKSTQITFNEEKVQQIYE